MPYLYQNYKTLEKKEKRYFQETKQSLKADSDMTQMLELSGKEFQIIMINM